MMTLEWVGPLLLCREEVTRVPESIPGFSLEEPICIY